MIYEKKAVVIGGGFAGLSGAALLEKNEDIGGQARLWNQDYYQLDRLDPAYRVYFEGQNSVEVP